jgi:hypothetical protein
MEKDLKYYTERFEYHSFYLQQSINSIGFSFHGKKVDLVQDVYLSLLNRIGVNIASIHHLSNFFIEENISSSIALLLRACISDIIFGYYLMDYINDEKTFEGEIKVKNVEFLKYIQKVGSKEQKVLSKKTGNVQLNFNELIINNYEGYFKKINNNGQVVFKSNSEIRKECGSKAIFINNDQNFSLTEEKIFENLRNKRPEMEDHFDSIYIFWRYCSQYQHYTHLGVALQKQGKEFFLYYFMSLLLETYNFLSVMQIFVFNFSVVNFDQVKNDLVQVYKEFKPDLIKSPA